MMTSLRYLDANVFVTAAKDSPAGGASVEAARRVVTAAASRRFSAMTSVLTWDEVAWVARKTGGHDSAVRSGRAFLGLPITFLPVSPAIIASAQSLVEAYSLKPRDAIHVATAIAAGCDCIVSDDVDFDAAKVIIKRLPLKKA